MPLLRLLPRRAPEQGRHLESVGRLHPSPAPRSRSSNAEREPPPIAGTAEPAAAAADPAAGAAGQSARAAPARNGRCLGSNTRGAADVCEHGLHQNGTARGQRLAKSTRSFLLAVATSWLCLENVIAFNFRMTVESTSVHNIGTKYRHLTRVLP